MRFPLLAPPAAGNGGVGASDGPGSSNLPSGSSGGEWAPQNDDEQAIVAEALGLDTNNKSVEEAASIARDEIQKLIRDDLGLPWRLRDVGVNEEDFPGIAKDAMEDLIVASNPRMVESEQEVIELLRKAW